jgi:hypothetical protein
MREKLLHWYHDCLQHPGVRRMQATVKEHLYWPKIDQDIVTYVKNCTVCQSYKMIGPWTVQFKLTDHPGKTVVQQLQALTIIDKGTGQVNK